MGLTILQWNARSLIANGQEFKNYVDCMSIKPGVICIQETWLIPKLDFSIKGYSSVRRDRENGRGGGIVTLVQKGIQFREIKRGKELEYLVLEVWTGKESMMIINFYNPCRQLDLGQLGEIWEGTKGRVMWCGDFNAHSILWGDRTDGNGDVLLEFMDGEGVVCLNDGSGTRYDMARGSESAIDLTLATATLAEKCEWEVLKDSTVGSDHFPIRIQIGIEVAVERETLAEKWVLQKAEWEKFREVSDDMLADIDISTDVETLSLNITAGILSAAVSTIPRTKPRELGKIVPWWNNECRQVVKGRNKAFKVLKRTHNFQDLIEYKKAQATVRRTVRTAKREYWRQFCDSVGRDTPVEKVWGMIRKMKGSGKEYGYPGLMDGQNIVTTSSGKAEVIAKTLSMVHSSDNLSPREKAARAETVRKFQINTESVGILEQELDMLFTMTELNNALRKLGKSSPGGDRICYAMLENLSGKGKEILLSLYNKVWEEGRIPKGWKESIIVPIKKPGKDPQIPSNYRPIALTSQMGKTMERMVNDRLTYIVESAGLLKHYQSGFRRARSTVDPLIMLEDAVRRAQVNKESVVAVFFDLEKAYDLMWKDGLLIKLHQMGLRGRVHAWVKEFLTDRRIMVRINGVMSKQYITENGIPQGSIISPLLFSLMINGIFKDVEGFVEVALFADDGALWKRGRNVDFVTSKIQQAVHLVDDWATQWGFRISIDKTKIMIFSRKNRIKDIPVKISGRELERVNSFKYLGIWFDQKLTWIQHIQTIVDRSKKVLNVMRCLCGTEWGASRPALRTIYIGLIRSIFDYGSMVYGSASKTLLKKLDVIQHQALRICCGAIRTTPVAAIQVEMGEAPLCLRREQLAVVYWANLRGHCANHMSQAVLQQCQERRSTKIGSFGWSIKDTVTKMGLSELKLSPAIPLPAVPPWTFEELDVDLGILENKNQDDFDKYWVQSYLMERYEDCLKIFTDASKQTDSRVGVGYVIPTLKHVEGKRITDDLAVYSGELIAVWLALQWVEEKRPRKVVVASDSSSALITIKTGQSETRQDIVLEIVLLASNLMKSGVGITFVWVPAHIGVLGNEMADKCAKKATEHPSIDMAVNVSKAEVKSMVKRKVKGEWQMLWEDGLTGRQFYNIHKKVGVLRPTSRSRREENVFSRMRFGHTSLNSNLHRIQKHADGNCVYCGYPETVDHVFIQCPRYQENRQSLIEQLEREKIQFNLQDILQRSTGEVCLNFVFRFLKNTGLFHRI